MYMPDKMHRAYSSIEDAIRTPLGKNQAVRAQLESIYQLIQVRDEHDGQDRWPIARKALQKLADDPYAAENLVYNYARMLDNRGRDKVKISGFQKCRHTSSNIGMRIRCR